MCEVAEYFENGELVIFDDSDPAPSYADEMESDEMDDSKSDFPEAECAMALLELAQSFGLVSSLNSFGHTNDETGLRNTTTVPSNVPLNHSAEYLASTGDARQHFSAFKNSIPIDESHLRGMPDCSTRTSAFDLLTVVRLDHCYEARRPHAPGSSTSSGYRAPKKAKSATTLDKLRKIRKRNGKRKTEIVERNDERQSAALESDSSPHVDRNIFAAAAVSHLKSQSHPHQSNTNAWKEVPLEERF